MRRKHKLLKELFTKVPIVLAAIVLLMAMVITVSEPIAVYADDSSMTEQESPGMSEYAGTGISYQHTGWLFYLLEPDGTPASTIKAILSYDGIIGTETGDWVTNLRLIATTGQRYINYDNIGTNAQWGPPFDNNANFRGNEVRDWLKSESDTEEGHFKAYTLIQQYWNEEAAIAWENKEVYLAFEPFYWGRVFKDGTSMGMWLAGTSSQWGVIQHVYEINHSHHDYVYTEEDMGDSLTNRYTNNVFPNCVTLDESPENQLLGYSTPASGGKLKNTQLFTSMVSTTRNLTGYGIGIVWNEKDSETSTYDESLSSSPGPAPDDSDDIPEIDLTVPSRYANIVKFYEETLVSADGTETVNRVSFTRTPTPKTIEIENEDPAGYTVQEWFTSSQYRKAEGRGPLYEAYKRELPNIQTGSSTGSVTLEETETTLYVLLVKTIEEEAPEPVESHFTIPQSKITERVYLSEAKLPLTVTNSTATTMTGIQFTFQHPAHNTTCNGHSYTDNCNSTCPGNHTQTCTEANCEEENCTTTHTYTCDGCSCPGHTSTCTWGKWTDNSLKVGLRNTLTTSYPDILAVNSPFQSHIVSVGGSSGITETSGFKSITLSNTEAHNSKVSGWDYVCILMRGKDKLTLAEWVNNGGGIPSPNTANTDLKNISTSGFSVANTDQGLRKISDYNDYFSVSFSQLTNSNTDYTTVYTPTNSGAKCSASSRTTALFTGDSGSGIIEINDISVLVEAYSGTSDLSTPDTSVPTNQLSYPVSGYSSNNGVMVSTNNAINSLIISHYNSMVYSSYSYYYIL